MFNRVPSAPCRSRRRKAKSGCGSRDGNREKEKERERERGKEEGRDKKARMMMRAKLIIPTDVNDYQPLLLLSSLLFFSLQCVSSFLVFVSLRFPRWTARFLNFDEAKGNEARL